MSVSFYIAHYCTVLQVRSCDVTLIGVARNFGVGGYEMLVRTGSVYRP